MSERMRGCIDCLNTTNGDCGRHDFVYVPVEAELEPIVYSLPLEAKDAGCVFRGNYEETAADRLEASYRMLIGLSRDLGAWAQACEKEALDIRFFLDKK